MIPTRWRYTILFSSVMALVIDQGLPPFFGKWLVLDFFAITLMASLGLIIKTCFTRISTEVPSPPGWRIVQAFLALWGIFFLILWEARWADVTHVLKYQTVLHAGAILAAVSIGMESRRVIRWWSHWELTPIRVSFVLYALALIFGTLLLILPWSLRPDASIQLVDALFTSVSALAVTGLSSVPFTSTFSLPGQAIVAVLIQIGGLGIVTLSVALAALARRRLSLSQSLMGQELFDVPNIGEISSFLIKVLLATLFFEGIGAVWIYFALPPDLESRLFHAVFHAVSAFCNAGFSTLPENMNTPGLVSLKTCVSLLIVAGGFGFPIFFEIVSRNRRFSSHAVLTLWTMGILLVGGAVGIFLAESFNPSHPLGWVERIGQSLFYSVSSRTAGFNMLPVDRLGIGTQFIIAFLMVIGGSPISTAGGIKTTTAGVMVAAAISVLRGHKWIQFHRSEIPSLVLQKCMAVVFLYFLVVFTAVLLLVATQGLDPWGLTFEAISAASTVGLTVGITEKLNSFGKLLIIGLMISGRVGLVVMVYVGIGKVVTQRFRYPTERYYVG